MQQNEDNLLLSVLNSKWHKYMQLENSQIVKVNTIKIVGVPLSPGFVQQGPGSAFAHKGTGFWTCEDFLSP